MIEVELVENKIPWLVARVDSAARAAVKKVADDIRDTMKDLAPVDTGEMQDSIESVSGVAGFEAEVVIGVDYWMFPNYGTRFQAAQPFVEPAISMHNEVELVDHIMVEGFGE